MVPLFRARSAVMTTVGMETAACRARTIISALTFPPVVGPTPARPAACKTSFGMARDVKHALKACSIPMALARLAKQSRAPNVRATTLGMERAVCSVQVTQSILQARLLQVIQQSNPTVTLLYVRCVRTTIFGTEIAVSHARHTKLLLVWQQAARRVAAG